MPAVQLTDADMARLGMEVPLPSVDKALKELWSQDSAKTRASLVNFAIYTEAGADLACNMQWLEEITAEHACRAILIVNNPEAAEPSARAFINALCRPYQGQQIVCSEQLAFLLEKGSALQVQNIVFAHLDSDLPLAVWWQGSLTERFRERLYSTIDTLIVDSSRWENPAVELDVLLQAQESQTSDFDVRDLSWTRSHFLRLALAGCVQDPIAMEMLPKVDSVEVIHGKDQRLSALLLGAWVAERLGGSLIEGPGTPTFRREDGPDIRLLVSEAEEGHALQGVTLSGDGSRIQISRDPQSPYVRVCASCGEHEHEEVFPADVETEAELIGEQLSRSGGKTLYAGMMTTLRKLV